jgi:hypothetical protein
MRPVQAVVNHSGERQVCKDVDSVWPSEDFVKVIDAAVRSCHTLPVVIGPSG